MLSRKRDVLIYIKLLAHDFRNQAIDRSNASFPFAAAEHLGAVDGSATGRGHDPAFNDVQTLLRVGNPRR
jgi:hypothetical protein